MSQLAPAKGAGKPTPPPSLEASFDREVTASGAVLDFDLKGEGKRVPSSGPRGV